MRWDRSERHYGINLCFGRCSWVLDMVFGLSLKYRSYFTARNTVANNMHDSKVEINTYHFLPYVTLARDHGARCHQELNQ